MNELKEYIQSVIAKYPQFKEQVMDLYQLCKDEVEAGESEQNEIYSCQSSIEDLIEEEENK